MPYIGHSPTNAGSFVELDDISSGFNGSTAGFTMQVGGVSVTPSIENLLICLDGVVQQPTSAFSISGSTITFTENVPSGTDFYGILMGQSATVGQGTITASEMAVTGNGTNGQLLKTDGDGTFTWIDQNTVTAPASGLQGNTLASGVTASSLTSVGTLTSLTTSGVITQDTNTTSNQLVLKNSNNATAIWIDNNNNSVDSALINIHGYNSSDMSNFMFLHGWDSNANATKFKVLGDGSATFSGNITQSADTSLRHTITAGGSGEASLVLTANNSTGDSFVRWETNANTFCMGLDNSDSNKFILSCGSDPHSNSVINIQPDGSSIAVDKPTSFNGNVTFAGGTTTLPVGGILRFGERGNITHDNSNYNMSFNTNSVSNAVVITGTGLLQAKRGFTNGQALDIEGETFGRTNSSSVAFGYRQDGNGQLMKMQKSSTDVFIMTNSGRIAQNINESEAYCATFENTSSGGYGLRVYGGASSADYLIRGHDHQGNDKFAVKSNGNVIAGYGIQTQGGSFEQYAISGGARSVRIIRQETGTFTGDFTIECSATSWKSVIYKVTIAGHQGSGDWTGMFYWNSGETSHSRSVEDYNGEVGNLSLSSYSGGSGNQGFKLTAGLGSSGIVHPIAIVEIISGGGYVLSNDDITVDFT